MFMHIYPFLRVPFFHRGIGMGTSTASARVSAFASAYAPLLVSHHKLLSVSRHYSGSMYNNYYLNQSGCNMRTDSREVFHSFQFSAIK